MHIRTLRKLALALTFWLALHASSLKAQILGPYGTSPTTFEVDANGLLSATGTFGTGSLSLSGAGTRMIWYPGKAAFRAGYVDDTEWDDANIAPYSVAFGYETTASGQYSLAYGEETLAGGNGTIAGGQFSVVWGDAAIGVGYDVSAGPTAAAFGSFTNAAGRNSLASGANTTASGRYAVALGYYTVASGAWSATAIGGATTASGYYTTASGYQTQANAYMAFSMGCFNVGGGNPSAWVDSDPLFEVGNGNSSSGYGNPDFTGPHDALVVYKNGNAALQGVLTVSPSPDIPVYTGE